ncbi:SDR family oxidoreductase [Endozoicomonas arenosclerae]|uniref:SDR family oxidoreductase n=1 Tax=Endozoicomonas arenosclerae TaxID=1633495 RepID=UPI0007842306|nr:NAD(P)-dependent oxidoreductase [Endozoicomonas arenosclerae]
MSQEETTSLKGKTVFLSGGSRGIGLAIAKRFARAGANIAICSKTAEPHPKLPGTIHETAEQVRALGGKALPIVMDVRDEKAVQAAVAETVSVFGGIDICINNAAAFWMEHSMATAIKRHDLLFDVNERGTFMVTQACYPHLKKSENPHILNLAPPLDIKPVWFKYTSPYSVSKFAVSLYSLGWASEFKDDGIAVNTLWPRVGIDSPAAIVHGGESLRSEFRKPDIMADAAFAIVSKPSKEFTGHFCIDDTLLYEEGVRDLEQYSMVPGSALVPDYFVPENIPVPPGVKLSQPRLYDFYEDEE